MRTKPHKYTTEQIDFLRDNVKGRSRKELTEMFNAHFNLQLTNTQIEATLKRNNLKNGINCTFKKGRTPFNKGMKGVYFGGETGKRTQFKKGQTPVNYRPIGSERVNVEGYIEVKVADPNKWRHKHLAIWEKKNGPLPKGYVVIFGDGDKRNFNLDNLLLVSRKQLLVLNSNNLIKDDTELTKTGILVADIYCKINERKREK